MWSVEVELDPVRYWLRCAGCDDRMPLQPGQTLSTQARTFTLGHVCRRVPDEVAARV